MINATGTGVNAFDLAHHGRRRRIARRVIEAMIDEALDRARAQPEQYARIYRVRNHTLAAIDGYLEDGNGDLCAVVEAELRAEVRRCFGEDPADVLSSGAREARPRHRQVAETIVRSVREAYGVLTPPQRQVVADYVRTNLG